MKERAIFIGRFQPFHLGHLSVIEKINQEEDVGEIIIGIGSSQVSHVFLNPFTAGEREEMVRKSLVNIKKPFHIVEIPDINSDKEWVSHVENLTPPFKIAYGGNPWVQELFKDKGYKVKNLDPLHQISATQIRERIIQRKKWQHLVPPGTLEVMKEINGAKRVREIYNKHLRPAVTTDLIIPRPEGIVLIKRRNGPGSIFGGMWALPGGFVEAGKETVEQAAVREGFEETSLKINPLRLELFGVYSSLWRDPRQPTVSLAYIANETEGELKAGDDAADIGAFPLDNLPPLAFDHDKIVQDYKDKKII